MSKIDSPFTVIRGGQAEPEKPVKTKYVKFDVRKEIGDRMEARHLAERERVILRERAKLAKKQDSSDAK